jgi:ribosome biogenesis GTPase
MSLESLGWTKARDEAFAAHAADGLVPARVAVEHRNRFGVYSAAGEVEAAAAGRLRHAARSRLDLPAVGDWVALEPPPQAGLGKIVAVLPRHSAFTRRVAGREHEEQIVAANVDVVYIVTSLNADLNARRLERYLTLAWESGARPVVVLSKADLVGDPEPLRLEIERVAPGVPVHVTSARTGDGLAALIRHLRGRRTGALLGSSGTGKSTLVNVLLGYRRQATAEVREADSRGRHTTTRRELIRLPAGGLLIDTPGMRELQLSEAGHGLLAAFEDIEALGAGCAFRDCTHGPEPDCAVKAALKAGRLDPERLASFHKLHKELALHQRQFDPRLARQARAQERVVDRALQKHLKAKRRS